MYVCIIGDFDERTGDPLARLPVCPPESDCTMLEILHLIWCFVNVVHVRGGTCVRWVIAFNNIALAAQDSELDSVARPASVLRAARSTEPA